MWLENSPVSPLNRPALHQLVRRVRYGYQPDPAADHRRQRVYGATVTSGGAKWMHGMMSDAFYQYLQQMPVGGSFTMTINACQTSVNYDASSGARCRIRPPVTGMCATSPHQSREPAVDYTTRWRRCLSTAMACRPSGKERRLPDADHRQPLRIKL